jgi:hypothetical protein
VLEWKANLIVGTGAILGIDVRPYGNISQKLIKDFSDQVVKLNYRNISILIRFAPDMNGNLNLLIDRELVDLWTKSFGFQVLV